MEVLNPIQHQDQIVDPQSLGISPQTWAKLETVKTNVNDIIDRVERLHNQKDLLNVSELQRDPDGRKKVAQIQKSAAFYSEELLKQLMSLDAIVGEEGARPIRKAQVVLIQKVMAVLDQIIKDALLLMDQLPEPLTTKAVVEAEENTKPLSSDSEEQIAKNEEATPQAEEVLKNLEQLDLNKADAVKESSSKPEEVKPEVREEKVEGGVQEKPQSKPVPQTRAGPGRPKQQRHVRHEQHAQQRTPPINHQPNHPVRQQIRQEVGRPWVPEADVRELPQGFLIQFTLPGVSKNDIELSLDEDILTVRGVRHVPAHIRNNPYLREQIEGNFGPFERSFQLPRSVNKQQIKADKERGILEIFVPKKVTYQEPRYVYRQPTRVHYQPQNFWELF